MSDRPVQSMPYAGTAGGIVGGALGGLLVNAAVSYLFDVRLGSAIVPLSAGLGGVIGSCMGVKLRDYLKTKKDWY